MPGALFELAPRSRGRTGGLSVRSSSELMGGWALASSSPSPPHFAARPDSAGRRARPSPRRCADRQERMCPLPGDLCPQGRKGVGRSQPCVSSGDRETRAQPVSSRVHPSRHPGQSASATLSRLGRKLAAPQAMHRAHQHANTCPRAQREGAGVGKAGSTPKPGSLAQSPAHSLLPGPEKQGRI